MTLRHGFQGRLLETYLDRDVSPIIAAIARHHVPEACRRDLVGFVSTGCSTEQLQMIIRYMGGTRPPLTHIEIEEIGGALYSSAQIEGGLNFTGNAVMMTARIPETLRQALTGRPLSALVDHHLLPGMAVIRRINVLGSIITAELDGDDPSTTSYTIGKETQ